VRETSHRLRGRIFLGASAVAGGPVTAAELRGPAFRPLLRGIYADASLPVGHRHRCLAVAEWLLPTGGAIAGRSAAFLLGAAWPPPDERVEIAVPPGTNVRAASVRTHRVALTGADIRPIGRIPVTTPVRTCWDLAQWLDPVDAVVLLDRMVARRLISVAEISEYARSRAAQRGWKRALSVASLVDPGAESPQESRVRVRLVLAGLPRPVTQYVITTEDGRFVARADLAWPEERVAVEYDGLWHAGSTDQIHADRRRLNAVLGADWLVLHITAKRLREDFEGFVAEVQAALDARRRRRPQDPNN
jgi:very-short-patch-repair endonuclease